MHGSKKQFDVSWNATKNAINLTSGKAYTPVGGELSLASEEDTTASPTTASFYLDGIQATLTAYNINGNNYFKLRDLAKAVNFGVVWDSATNTIGIFPSTSYHD